MQVKDLKWDSYGDKYSSIMAIVILLLFIVQPVATFSVIKNFWKKKQLDAP